MRRCCCVSGMPSTRGTNATFSSTVLVGQQLEILEDEAERAAVGLHLARRERREVAAADDQLALGRHVLAQQQPQQRGLAGAARAGEEDELPLVDAQRQVAQRVDAAAVESSRRDGPRSRLASVCPLSSPASAASLTQRRVRLAPGRLHHLADEEAERLLLAGAVLRDRIGVGREHLARPPRRSPPRRRCAPGLRRSTISSAARPAGEHLLEHLFARSAR